MGFRGFGLLVLLLAQCGLARAWQPQALSNGSVQEVGPTHTLSGVVVNSVTGRPIARALVQTGERAVLTDSEGHFELRDVPDGMFAGASKPGYFPEDGGGMLPQATAAQKEEKALELRLVPEAIVTGRVTDAHGAPLEGIPVTLRMLMVSSGLKHWQRPSDATTNAEGEFRIAELPAGEYAVQTTMKLDGPPEGDAAAGYAPAAFPETGALQVHAGDLLNAELSPRLEKLYPVTGVVSGDPGIGGLRFSVRTEGGAEVNAASRQNRQTGEFRMLLPSGSFELRAQAYVPGRQGPTIHAGPIAIGGQLLARRLVTVGQGPVSRVKMTLEPLPTVAIEVAAEKTAKAASNDRFATPDDPSQVSFVLLSADANAEQPMYFGQRSGNGPTVNGPLAAPGAQEAPKDGPLLIQNVLPGRYFLQLQGQPPWYIAAASCGGTDLTREPIAIAGSSSCAIRVVLRNDVASLKVSVANATPSRIYVYAVPLNNQTRDAQMFPTVADGTARLDGLAPGRYLLLAMRHATELAFRDPESLHRYEAEGSSVDLSPGTNPDVQLELTDGEP